MYGLTYKLLCSPFLVFCNNGLCQPLHFLLHCVLHYDVVIFRVFLQSTCFRVEDAMLYDLLGRFTEGGTAFAVRKPVQQ